MVCPFQKKTTYIAPGGYKVAQQDAAVIKEEFGMCEGPSCPAYYPEEVCINSRQDKKVLDRCKLIDNSTKVVI